MCTFSRGEIGGGQTLRRISCATRGRRRGANENGKKNNAIPCDKNVLIFKVKLKKKKTRSPLSLPRVSEPSAVLSQQRRSCGRCAFIHNQHRRTVRSSREMLLTVPVPLLKYIVARVAVERAVGPARAQRARFGHRTAVEIEVPAVAAATAETTTTSAAARSRDDGSGRTEATGTAQRFHADETVCARGKRNARRTRTTECARKEIFRLARLFTAPFNRRPGEVD